MNKTVAIIGMGWLGQSLAVNLLKQNYIVKGSVMTLEKATQLEQRGFDAIRIVVSDQEVQGRIQALLHDVDYAVIMIPPILRRDTGANYFLKMKHLSDEIKKYQVPKVILASSIVVYDDSQGSVTEKIIPKPQTVTAKQMREAEELFLNAQTFETTVVRFGGIFGGSRQPLRYLAGRKNLRNGRAPVNLIHRDDCVEILTTIIENDVMGHIFNAVYPEHPTKSDYYVERAHKVGLEPPYFENHYSMETYKRVDSDNLKQILNYNFKKSIYHTDSPY